MAAASISSSMVAYGSIHFAILSYSKLKFIVIDTTNHESIISPFAFFGFQYSFLAENIELKDNVKKPSAAYSTRIEFEDVYKGGVFGIGSRFLFKKNFGLVFRTGITTRGRSEDTTPDPNAVAEPTIIGGLTVDGFINAGIEYHWNWK